MNDSRIEMQRLAEFAASLPSLDGIELLPYHPIGIEKYNRLQREYALKEVQAPQLESLRRMADFLRSYDLEVHLGG
jgi:pyruvate formate lyase activating enzyme